MVGRAGRHVDRAVRRDGARGEVLGLRGAALRVLEVVDRERKDLLLEDELQAAVRVAHPLRRAEAVRIERELAALRAGEVVVAARRRVEAVDDVALAGVVDVEVPRAVRGERARRAEAAALVVPEQVAVVVGRDDRPARLRALPAEVDALRVARHGARVAVVAAPAAARDVVGVRAGAVRPAAQLEVQRLADDALPRVAAGGDRLADVRVEAGRKAVPEEFVRARRERLRGERPRDGLARGVLHDDRHLAGLVKREADRQEAGLLRRDLERAPVHLGDAVLHRDGERAAVREAQRLRRAGLVDERRAAPDVGAHERHHAVGLHALAEEVLRREALVAGGAVVRLEREQQEIAGGGAVGAVADQGPRDRDLLDVAAGDLAERLLHAARHHVLALRLGVLRERRAGGRDAVAVAPEVEVGELHRQPRRVRVVAQVVPDRARLRARREARLHAVALPGEVAAREAGVVHGRLVEPAEEEVEVVLVEHRRDPDAVARAERLHVGAAEDRAGEVPVGELRVDRHRARRADDAEVDVLGLGGAGGERRGEEKGSGGFHGDHSIREARGWSRWHRADCADFLARKANASDERGGTPRSSVAFVFRAIICA